jgi:hypothetical protein
MNLTTFKSHIKTVSQTTLNGYHDEIAAKLAKAKSPAARLGYALALDELCIESEMRKPCDMPEMSDEEMLAMLAA